MNRNDNTYSSGFCLYCFSAIHFRPGTRLITCENCNSSIDIDELKEILKFCYDAATYGYLYPKIEKKDKINKENKKYFLITNELLVWLALAALGGIVGNLAYDIVKTAFRKILEGKTEIDIYSKGKRDLKTDQVSIGYEKEITITITEEELDVFLSSINNYVEKCISDLSNENFDPPSGKEEFVKVFLKAQQKPDWPYPKMDTKQLEKKYDEFKKYYREHRKKSIITIRTHVNVFQRIGNKIKNK